MYFMTIPKIIEYCYKFVNECVIKVFYFITTLIYWVHSQALTICLHLLFNDLVSLCYFNNTVLNYRSDLYVLCKPTSSTHKENHLPIINSVSWIFTNNFANTHTHIHTYIYDGTWNLTELFQNLNWKSRKMFAFKEKLTHRNVNINLTSLQKN